MQLLQLPHCYITTQCCGKPSESSPSSWKARHIDRIRSQIFGEFASHCAPFELFMSIRSRSEGDDSLAFIRIAHLSLSQGMTGDPLAAVTWCSFSPAPCLRVARASVAAVRGLLLLLSVNFELTFLGNSKLHVCPHSDEGGAAPAGSVWMGVFACCPEEQDGCTATFHEFSIKRGTTFEHNADGNHEEDAGTCASKENAPAAGGAL
jgi:hypothetical protein